MKKLLNKTIYNSNRNCNKQFNPINNNGQTNNSNNYLKKYILLICKLIRC